MPYVPRDDRSALDAAVEELAQHTAKFIRGNETLVATYYSAFFFTAESLKWFLSEPGDMITIRVPYAILAEAIRNAGLKHGYEGAFLGELNYAMTRLIQRVPQIKIERGEWKATDELRYWLYARTVEALTRVAHDTLEWNMGISGVFTDVKDEYKRRVNTAYEAAQILKSGDCYDTPYYTRLVEVVDKHGVVIGHQEIMLKRNEKSVGQDLLDFQIVANKR